MEVREICAYSRDGTRIAIYDMGVNDGPAMVLANGLGGNVVAWRHLITHFCGRMRIVTWDYRGLYRSGSPPDCSPSAFDMARHCDDLEAVLGTLGIEQAVYVGWSMGVQVALEFYRRRPESFVGLVLINGTYGRPFDTAFRSSVLRKFGPDFLRAMPLLSPLFRRSEPLVTRTRLFVSLVKAFGLVSPTLDEAVFFDLARDWLNLDFWAYAAIFRCLAEHDAKDVLDSIRVPTLVITGERDLFTPIELSKEMVRQIPDAELCVIAGGSHYTPIEYPVIVNLRIQQFLEKRVGLAEKGAKARKTSQKSRGPSTKKRPSRKRPQA